MPTIYKPKRKHTLPYKKHNKQGDIQKLYNSTTWQKLRNSYLMEHPLCENCLKHNKVTPATCVHHKLIISSKESELEMRNVAFDSNNLMSLCNDCHNKFHTLARQRNMNYIDFIKLD